MAERENGNGRTVRMEWGRAVLDLYWVELRDAAKHLVMHMTFPHN